MSHRNISLFVPHLGCPHTCIFCNQRTISGSCGNLTDEEIISACETAIKSDYKAQDSEIAFFGGSFTAIDRDLMVHYLETVQPYIGEYFSGIRVSTRPDAIDDETLSILKKYHVTAIELGAQSTDDTVLEKNERGHKTEQTVKSSAMIKSYGFSLGLQMMTGLYGSDYDTDIKTASDFVSMKPDTVRIYPTVVLEGTALADLYRSGEYNPPSVDESVELCSRLLELFYNNNIKVIRLGLHSGGNVADGFVAGVFHPAFGELCMSRIYRNRIEKLLSDMPHGSYTLLIPEGEISKAYGQKKANKTYFENCGYKLSFKESDLLQTYDVRISE